MIFVLLSILFKVIPPNKVVSSNKPIAKEFLVCGDHKGEIHQDKGTDNYWYISCEISGSTMLVENCKFIDIVVNRFNWAHFMLFRNADLNFISCLFERVTYKEKFMSLQDHSNTNYLKFYSNTIIDCNQLKEYESSLIYSEYQINDIRHNILNLNKKFIQTRAFEIKAHRGCKLINNTVQNANRDDGSCILYSENQGGSNTPIEITDCIFKNCKGSNIGSIMNILNVNDVITIRNLTLQDTTNAYVYEGGTIFNRIYYSKGYFFHFQCSCNPAKAIFIGCHFLNLESNAQSGGGIGLLLTNDNDHELYFEDTNFEHIKFTHDSYCGGAISFSSEVEQNQKTDVFIKNCLFNDVTSKNGGGAIYFNAPTKGLTVENTRFINTYSNDDDTNKKGGAIYVKFSQDTMPITIKSCYFEDTKSYYGGAIYIEWNKDSQSPVMIDNCTFYKVKSKSNGFAIVASSCEKNTVTISNCNFNDCVDNANYFTVNLDVLNLNFLYNKFVYSNADICGGCINLEKVGNHVFNGNLFQNYRFDDSDTDIKVSGGINCFSLADLTSFTFINNTFDNVFGNTQGRCIRFSDIPNNQIIIRNNTIKNCPVGGPFFYFKFNNKIDDFTIESCNFVENNINSYIDYNVQSQITPQVWVENSQNGNYRNKFKLIFDDCYFKKNISPAEGGAINYGKGNMFVNTRVVFQECQFIENEAKNGGAAIAIETYQGCEINGCKFIKNKSEEGFGTVHIKTQFSISESREEEVLITKSIFDENECKESHAIHIIESDILIHISNCSFNNCGANDYVISVKSQPQLILLENNDLQFTKGDTSACGVCFQTNNFNLIGNTFHNFKNTVVRFYGQPTDEKQSQIIDNTFSQCSGDSIIDAENQIQISPKIKGNTFKDISIISNLLSFKLNNKVDQLTFDNNTFLNFNINTDLGGIGIDINHESNDISFLLSFSDCFFININNKEKQQTGGAISCSNSINRANVQLSITDCFFGENQNEGKGSAIYANIQHSITIEKCNFSENSGSEKGSVYIEPDNNNSSTSSILIKECNFYKNNVKSCSSIYIASGSTKSIQIDSCNFKEEKGAIVLDSFKNTIEIKNCNFNNILDSSSLIINHPADSLSDSKILIKECTFDSCLAIENKCFDVNSNTRDFTFENNVIQNNRGTGPDNYFGKFNLNDNILTFSIYNVSFINNVCDSLYGGGIGIQFYGFSQLTFYKCNFKENGSKQNQSKSRPTQSNEQTYYNGDGGAVQLGYICTMNNLNILFKECVFENNHAERHGGAIAIQTSMIVVIENCIFENNAANYDFASLSSNLLTENHFHKKSEGRGGAIYINPSYTYDDSSVDCKLSDHFMQDVQIKGCQFIKNNGFDGYGIFIEGDDIEIPFTITNNNFTDNYNKDNHENDENQIYGAVIATEITCIKKEQVNKENTFSYTNPDINVRSISYVDHYGKTPTYGFTKSDIFTKSDLFSSKYFSNSDKFSQSTMFSSSNAFSSSNSLDIDIITKSDHFSHSNDFTESYKFTDSQKFSNPNRFSSSSDFTKSKEFLQSDKFSKSSIFSGSKFFSQSDAFTISNKFSPSIQFSQSLVFKATSILIDAEKPSINNEETTIITESIENKITETQIKITNTEPIITDENSQILQTNENKPTIQVTKNVDSQQPSIFESYQSTQVSNNGFGGGINSNAKSKKKNTTLIIGVVVGVVVVIVLVILLIIFIIHKKRNTATSDFSQNEMTISENSINSTKSEIEDFNNPLFNEMHGQKDPFEQSFEEDII